MKMSHIATVGTSKPQRLLMEIVDFKGAHTSTN